MRRQIANEEVRIQDLIRTLWRWKSWIVLTTLAVMAITAGVSLAMPKTYRATAVLLPPEVDQAWPTIDGLKTRFGAAAIGGSLKPNTTATDVIMGILKSRRIAVAVIDKFDLSKVYAEEPALIKLPRIPLGGSGGSGGPTLSDTVKTFESRTEVRATKEGLLSISIEDQAPGRAAEMVQFCLDELGRINVELQTTYNQYLSRILDPPITPDKKYKPRVMINTLISGVCMSFLWLLIVCGRLSLAGTAAPQPNIELKREQLADPMAVPTSP